MIDLIPNKICHCSDEKPKLLQVKIINKCNGRCQFCIDKGNYAPEEVDADKIIEAILSEPDYPTVDITGGEPFLDFDVLLKVLKAIRPYKEYIIVNTNGSLLTKDKVQQLNGLIDLLKIAMHHYNENINSNIIGTKISYENIKTALEGKEFRASLNMVITKAIVQDMDTYIDKVVDLCKYLKIEAVNMNELRYVGVNHGYPEYAKDHVKGYDFFKNINVIKYKTSEQLITDGCVDDFTYKGIDFRLKRLCGYKLKPTKPTFIVVYSNGEKLNDWISQEKHDEFFKKHIK